MKALVVINPIAGPGRSRAIGACVDLARTVFATHQFETDIRITTGPGDAYRFGCEGVQGGADLVVVWGGDGTVNGCAAAVAGTGVPLAIIPGGSGNGLARDLMLPFNATHAFQVAATGRVRSIDAGDLHGSLFFNVAGIGFDARIADRLAAPGARRGLLGYILATVGELRGYEPGRYSIHNAFDVEGTALTPASRSPRAVHRARQLAPMRQRRANRAAGTARRWDDRDRGGGTAVRVQHHAAGAGVFSRHAARRTGPADAKRGVDGDCLLAPDPLSRGRRASRRPELHSATHEAARPFR